MATTGQQRDDEARTRLLARENAYRTAFKAHLRTETARTVPPAHLCRRACRNRPPATCRPTR
jgi:hypothetical protein